MEGWCNAGIAGSSEGDFAGQHLQGTDCTLNLGGNFALSSGVQSGRNNASLEIRSL